MSRLTGRIRPAGESSDEDEFADYMSDDDVPLSRITSTVDAKELENERIFQVFLNTNMTDVISVLDGGFNVNEVLRDNWTALLLAASVGAPVVTAELIARGADVNMHRDYFTPLMAAASCPKSTSSYENSLLVVRQLLENNADVNAKTRKRMNALMFAAYNGNCSIIKELLPCCDKMVEDNQGWTALFWAVNGNSKEAVKLLLEEELPWDKFDVRGNLPIHCAKENGYNDIIEILPSLSEEENSNLIFNEYGYQNFFEDGRSDFLQDVATMLYGMKKEKYFVNFLNNDITLFRFLTITEDDLLNIRINMPYERYQILNALYRFHKHPFKTKAIPIIGKLEPYSTLNVANTLLSACRQFTVMQASLRYILENISNLEELRDFDKEIEQIRKSLNKIKYIVNKINLQAIEWDCDTKPADRITKASRQQLKSKKIKYCFTLSILSLISYAIWKFR